MSLDKSKMDRDFLCPIQILGRVAETMPNTLKFCDLVKLVAYWQSKCV
jgi:hypothetical protein